MTILTCSTLKADCIQTAGHTDFSHTPLKLALNRQYKYLMAKNLRYAIVEQYAKTSIVLVSICT